jgi:hypothetical protein
LYAIRCSVRSGGFACVIVVAGCYAPKYRDCAISCTEDIGCPSGLSCDTGSHLCSKGGACEVPDASFDCWTSLGGMTPTNFSPCAPSWPPAIASWMLPTGGTTLCTDTGTIGSTCSASDPAAPGTRYSIDGVHEVWLIHATDVGLPAGANLIVRGSTPLLIVSEHDVNVQASINAQGANHDNGAFATACGDLSGTTSSVAIEASGGGGGGNASAGGAGSTDGLGHTMGGKAGPAISNATLSPLVPGCIGGTGGSTSGGVGGNGGGAIEIASLGTITISNALLAGGLAGHGGVAKTTSIGGGGGGGAGGSILFEAPAVNIAGMVCATGAGGGGGASMTAMGGNGTDGVCTAGIGAGASGGDGSGGVTTPGAPGSVTMGSTTGGGGGGGGSGRVRAHTRVLVNNGVIAPTATLDSN